MYSTSNRSSSLESLLSDLGNYRLDKSQVVSSIYNLISRSSKHDWKPEEIMEQMSPYITPFVNSKRLTDISSFAQSQNPTLRWEALRLLALLAKCSIGRRGILYYQGIDALADRLQYGDDREVNLAADSLALVLNYHTSPREISEFAEKIYSAAKIAFVTRKKRSLSMVALLHSLLDRCVSHRFAQKMESDGILDGLLELNHANMSSSYISVLGFGRAKYSQKAHSDKGFFFGLLMWIANSSKAGKKKMIQMGWLENLAAEFSKPLLSNCEAASLLTTLLTRPNIAANHQRFAKTNGLHSMIAYLFKTRRATDRLTVSVRLAYATALREIMRQECYMTALDSFSLTEAGRRYSALLALKCLIDQAPESGNFPRSDIRTMHYALSSNIEKRERQRKKERAAARTRKQEAQAERKIENSSSSQMLASDLSIGIEIGRGGFSVVHKGFYKRQAVAIKKMLVGQVSPDGQEIIQKEAAFLKQLKSDHIVRFLGLCFQSQSGIYLLVMEYMAAGSLAHILATEANTLSWEEKLEFARDVSRGIAYLHNLRPAVIHGDIKAGNVLIRQHTGSSKKTRSACLSDFGLATVQDKTKTYASETSSNAATMAKGAAGTLPFMAPEQLDPEVNAASSRSTDRYSQGVLLCQIAMCQQPWSHIKIPYMIPGLVMAGKRPKVNEERVKPFYKKQVERCWHQDPRHRPDANSVLKALLEPSCTS